MSKSDVYRVKSGTHNFTVHDVAEVDTGDPAGVRFLDGDGHLIGLFRDVEAILRVHVETEERARYFINGQELTDA